MNAESFATHVFRFVKSCSNGEYTVLSTCSRTTMPTHERKRKPPRDTVSQAGVIAAICPIETCFVKVVDDAIEGQHCGTTTQRVLIVLVGLVVCLIRLV